MMSRCQTTITVPRRCVPVSRKTGRGENNCRGTQLRHFCLEFPLLLILAFILLQISKVYATDVSTELAIFREMEAKRRAAFDDVKIFFHREEVVPEETYKIIVDDTVSPPIIRESNTLDYDEEIWFKGGSLMYRSTGLTHWYGPGRKEVFYKTEDSIDVFNSESNFSKKFQSEAEFGGIPLGEIIHNKKSGIFNTIIFTPIRWQTGRSFELLDHDVENADIITRESPSIFEDIPCAAYKLVILGDKSKKSRRTDVFVLEESSYLPIGLNFYYGDELFLTISLLYNSFEEEVPVPAGWRIRTMERYTNAIITKIVFHSELQSSDFDIQFPPRTSFVEEFPDEGREEVWVVLENGKHRRITEAEHERLMFAGRETWEEVYKTPTGMAGLIKSEHLRIIPFFLLGIGMALAILIFGKLKFKG